MSNKQEENAAKKGKGIRLNHLNLLLISVGLILCALMVISMYQMTSSVKNIVSVTDTFLNNQQAGGMLRDLSSGMSEQAMAFVQSGEPGPANAYAGQMNALSEQLALYEPAPGNRPSDAAYQEALDTYNRQRETDIRAMRLVAETLPQPLYEALPDIIKDAEPADPSLSGEEKKAAAIALLTSEEYASYASTIQTAVDNSHRLSSEDGKEQAAETNVHVRAIVRTQKILVFLFVVVAVLALVLNRLLIISPIQKSVDNLDRSEPIPEKGSYEMRHLARVYNSVLQDNKDKTEALSYAASHDALTGLNNRAVFDRKYQALKKGEIGLIIADVDHFKQYNDEFGHDIGDRVLRMAADGLKRNFRAEDLICRIGGDEFAVIMPGLGQANAGEIRERIVRINEELKEAGSDLPPITLSAGIAFHDRPDPKGSLFKDADSILLEHKKTRDTCCAVFGEE